MAPTPTTSIHLVRVLLGYVAREGRDFDTFCAAIGMTPDDEIFRDAEARISTRRFDMIFREAEAHVPSENFGLDFGREVAGSHFGGNVLFVLMMNSPTVGAALEHLIRYHDLMADAIRPRMRIERDCAHLTWSIIDTGFEISRSASEALLSATALILSQMTEGRLPLTEVRFSYPAPRDESQYERAFSAPLKFDEPLTELVIDKAYLDMPVTLASPRLLETLEKFAQDLLHKHYFADTTSYRVAQWIAATFLRGNKIAVDNVAKDLGQSPRSLQNKLREEGTSFQKLLDQVRRDLAEDYMKSGEISYGEIALLLGYSEQSAFNHAFKRWTGTTPGEFKGRQ